MEAVEPVPGGLPTRSKLSVTVLPGVRWEMSRVTWRPSKVTPAAVDTEPPGLALKNDVASGRKVGTTELSEASSREASKASGRPPAGLSSPNATRSNDSVCGRAGTTNDCCSEVSRLLPSWNCATPLLATAGPLAVQPLNPVAKLPLLM